MIPGNLHFVTVNTSILFSGGGKKYIVLEIHVSYILAALLWLVPSFTHLTKSKQVAILKKVFPVIVINEGLLL